MKKMKMYRCLTHDYVISKGTIHPEDYTGGDVGYNVVEFAKEYPEDWELVTETPQPKGNPTPFELLDYLAEKEREFKKNNR